MNLVKILAYVAYYDMIKDLIEAVKLARSGKPFKFIGSYKVNGKRVYIDATGTVDE